MTATLGALVCALGTVQQASGLERQPPDLTGTWQGKLTLPQGEVRIVFHLASRDSGYAATLDSPDQNATGIPVSEVTVKADTVHLTVEGSQGRTTESYSKAVSGW